MDPTAADIDLEKANGTSGEPPYSPNSQSTWESQKETLHSSPIGERIIIEEDTDEESVHRQEPVTRTARFMKGYYSKILC